MSFVPFQVSWKHTDRGLRRGQGVNADAEPCRPRINAHV